MEHAALLPPEEDHPAPAEAPQTREGEESHEHLADEGMNGKGENVPNGTAAADAVSANEVLDVGTKEGASANGTNRLQGQKTEDDWTML